MSPSMFRGSDDEGAVLRLIVACQRKVVTAPLIERDLVPWVDEDGTPNPVKRHQPTVAASGRTAGQKNNRSGSPSSSGSGSDTPQSDQNSRRNKGSRRVMKAAKMATAAAAAAPPSPLTTASLTTFNGRLGLVAAGGGGTAATAAAGAAAKKGKVAACPAMFKSAPKASDLPMPSSSLLLRRTLAASVVGAGVAAPAAAVAAFVSGPAFIVPMARMVMVAV